MNKGQKEIEQLKISHEQKAFQELRKTYTRALADTKEMVKKLQEDVSILQGSSITDESIVRSRIYQLKKKKAMELLEYMNLTDRKDHKPSMLSGGEQQRIAVARALINNPSIVLADEPSGNLDSQSAKELHELFFKLRDKTNQTFVIVTHNPQLAEMADTTYKMKDGLIIFDKN